MEISLAPPVSQRPRVELTHWAIVQAFTGAFYFVGRCSALHRHIFSTPVQVFDPVMRLGITQSGRVYQMLGDYGLDAGGLELLDIFQAANQLDYFDVTEQLLTKGTTAINDVSQDDALRVSALLVLLDWDMAALLKRARPITPELMARVRSLLGELHIDLDEPLNPTDDEE